MCARLVLSIGPEYVVEYACTSEDCKTLFRNRQSYLNDVQYFSPLPLMACLALVRFAESLILASLSPDPLHLSSKSLPLHLSCLELGWYVTQEQ